MRLLKNLSIKHKLILVMMGTSCAAIMLMALLIVVNQAINSHRAIQQQLTALADALGSTSTAALSFDDPAAGTEILNALALKSNITYAAIERPNGKVFVEFENRSGTDAPLDAHWLRRIKRPRFLWFDLLANEIQVERGVYLENERIGIIRIVSTLNNFRRDLLNYVFLVIGISLVCFTATFLICSRLQKVISGPIVNLHRAMDSVSENNDYALRVENDEKNELGSLVDGFNHMLEQIQLRDSKLAEYNTLLEKIVAERTLELTNANKKRILWLEMMAKFLRHELKNSYVGIKLSLDLIERRSLENKKIDIYLNRARTSMANMNNLLQSAGEASNLEAVLYKEEHECLNLTSTILNHMATYSSIYPDLPMKVDCQQKTHILGSKFRIRQLLDNLINNAVQHSDSRFPIEVNVKQHDGKALLIVTNRGDALPDDKQSIFDLFISLRTAERKNDDNFGLGLYIVKLIAESHGGQAKARDLSGNETGAIFEISFPLQSRSS